MTDAPILALDIGTNLGFSFHKGGRLEWAGLLQLPSDRALRFRTFRNFVRLGLADQSQISGSVKIGQITEHLAPRMICHEALFVPPQRGSKRSNIPALLTLFGMVAILEGETARENCIIKSVQVASIRAAIAGKKSATKEETSRALILRGDVKASDVEGQALDLTDAIALGCYSAAVF